MINFGAALIIALIMAAPFLPAQNLRQKSLISLFMMIFISLSLGGYGLLGMADAPQRRVAHEAKIAAQIEAQNAARQARLDAQAQQGAKGVGPEQIMAMVNGLAQRLAQDPEDPEGWTRLIRSRIVLQDFSQLIEDHKTMSQIYKDRPEIQAQITNESGFTAFAQALLPKENGNISE